MVTFQIASDLHIEEEKDEFIDPLEYIKPSSDILILAGDIGSLYKIEQLTYFLTKLCSNFFLVLYIPGNHEWYTMKGYIPLSRDSLEKRIYTLEKSIRNLKILNRNSILIGNLCVVGTTLWTNIENNKVPPYIVRINGMGTKEYRNNHTKDLDYIKKMIPYCKNNNHELLIVTHHPPTKKVLINTNKRKKFLYLYGSDLDYLLDANFVSAWVCGHVHKNFDFISDKGCRIIGNQKGKKKDKITDYRKDFLFTV